MVAVYPDGDPKAVNEIEYELLASTWGTDGLHGSPADAAPVYSASGVNREVRFRSGRHAVVRGWGWSSGLSDLTFNASTNASGQPRVDMVVLGLDRTTWAVSAYVRPGTPAASPSPATAVRDASGTSTGVWEMPVATFLVPSGATVVQPADITIVAPYVSTGSPFVAPTVAALSRFPTMTPGQLAWVDNPGRLYSYVSGTGWRRADWLSPWGIIGGKRYNIGSTLRGNGILTETIVNIDSGAVTLEANRRYRLHAATRLGSNVANNYLVTRARESNISGAIVLEQCAFIGPGINAPHDFHWWAEFTTTAAATKTYTMTVQSGSGGGQVWNGSPQTACGLWVEDVGPAVPNVVTTSIS